MPVSDPFRKYFKQLIAEANKRQPVSMASPNDRRRSWNGRIEAIIWFAESPVIS